MYSINMTVEDRNEIHYRFIVETDPVKKFNIFLELYCEEYYAHLIDSDDNPGEEMRQLISRLQDESIQNFRFKNDEFLLCETCFNRQGSRFGGAVMTSWNCARCSGGYVAGNTAHQTICDGCSLAYGKCKWCNHNDNRLETSRKENIVK